MHRFTGKRVFVKWKILSSSKYLALMFSSTRMKLTLPTRLTKS